MEAKRVELTNMIQNLHTSNYKETLENQIIKMEMKLSINCVSVTVKDKGEVIDDGLEIRKKIKCRYNDRGYCILEIVNIGWEIPGAVLRRRMQVLAYFKQERYTCQKKSIMIQNVQ